MDLNLSQTRVYKTKEHGEYSNIENYKYSPKTLTDPDVMEDTASLFRNTSKVQPSPDSLYRVYGKPKVKTGNGQLVPNGKVGPAPRGRALSPKPTSCKKDDSGSHPGEINTSDQSDIILQLERDQRVNDVRLYTFNYVFFILVFVNFVQ